MNKLLIVPMFALLSIGVTQNLTADEQLFIDLLGQGEKVTLTHGQGISIWNGQSYVPYAYGEEQFQTTIETSFKVTEFRCIEKTDETHQYAECYLRGDNSFIGGDGVSYTWDWTEGEYVPTDKLIEEAKDKVSDTIDIVIASETHDLVPVREDEQVISEEDQSFQAQIELTDECAYNILAWQTFDLFDVEYDEFGDPIISKDVDNTKWRSGSPEHQEAMNNNACLAQRAQHAMIGDRTFNVVDYNKYHAEVAEDIPTWSREKLTEVQNFGLEKWNGMDMCNSNNSIATKEMYGCTIDRKFPEGTGNAPAMTDFHDNEAMKNFFAWHENPDSQISDILKKQGSHHERAQNIGGQR